MGIMFNVARNCLQAPQLAPALEVLIDVPNHHVEFLLLFFELLGTSPLKFPKWFGRTTTDRKHLGEWGAFPPNSRRLRGKVAALFEDFDG